MGLPQSGAEPPSQRLATAFFYPALPAEGEKPNYRIRFFLQENKELK
jgi:hypothetical protein